MIDPQSLILDGNEEMLERELETKIKAFWQDYEDDEDTSDEYREIEENRPTGLISGNDY